MLYIIGHMLKRFATFGRYTFREIALHTREYLVVEPPLSSIPCAVSAKSIPAAAVVRRRNDRIRRPLMAAVVKESRKGSRTNPCVVWWFAQNPNTAGGEESVPKLPSQQAARVPQLPSRRDTPRRELVQRPWRGAERRRRRRFDRGRLREPSVRCVGEHVDQHQGWLWSELVGARPRARLRLQVVEALCTLSVLSFGSTHVGCVLLNSGSKAPERAQKAACRPSMYVSRQHSFVATRKLRWIGVHYRCLQQ